MKTKSEKKTQPTVDLGYPTSAHGRIPAFENIEEEAEFWDTHSVLDFPDEFEYVGFEEPRAKKDAPITIRLDYADRTRLKAEAEKMGIGPSTLARIWIKEKLAG
jgi:predicted DNA binding CopG/RHH family protein